MGVKLSPQPSHERIVHGTRLQLSKLGLIVYQVLQSRGGTRKISLRGLRAGRVGIS